MYAIMCMIVTVKVDFETFASMFSKTLCLHNHIVNGQHVLKKPTRWFAMSQQELRALRGIVFSQLDTLQALTQVLFTKVELFQSGVVKNKGEHEETEKELQKVKALLAGL